MNLSRGRRLGFSLAVALLLAIPAPAAQACCPEQPDLRIRKPGGVLKGNNVYGTVVGQTIGAGNAPGTRRQFIITVQNDTVYEVPIQFSVDSSESQGDPVVSYKIGWPGSDITGSITGGNTRTTPTLPPNGIYYLRVYVRFPHDAEPGDYYRATLHASAGISHDYVQFRVTVI